MWATARYDLHLSDSEFWRLTPAEYDALLERHYEAHRRAMLCSGVIAATIVNYAGRMLPEDADAVSPLDFVPGYHKPERRQTLREQISILTAIFGCGPNLDEVN